MERDPPKKKKKYVALNSTKQGKQETKQKSTFIEKDKPQNKALERARFDYTFQEIINHLLARLLPDSNFTIKLSQKLIFGQQKALDSFVAKLDNNIKYTTGLVIQLNEGKTKQDVDFKLAEEFKAKSFNSKLIEMSVKNFFDGTKYQREYFTFLSQFKSTQKNRLYIRLNKFYVNEFLEAIQEEGGMAQDQQVEEKPKRGNRGNRTRFKVIADSIEVSADSLNIADVMKFFSRSDKLDRHDIQIESNKDQEGNLVSYKVSLKCFQQEKENKLTGFRYYFRHQNFVSLPLKESKHKAQLCDEYGDLQEKNIKIKLIKGYKSSKWDDKNLLYKIRMNQISKKKTNYTNEYFEAFHLVGLLPTVKEYIEELQHRINQVPLDDLRQELFIQFDEKIKDYIRSSQKVETYIQKFIKAYMERYHSSICELESVKFPIRGVKLNLKIKRSEEQNFHIIEKNISQMMPNNIVSQIIQSSFQIDKQILSRLQEASIVIVEHKEKEFTFISSTDELFQISNKIQKILQQFQRFQEHSLEVFGLIKKSKYMDIINNLKEKNTYYNQIFVDSISEDKMKFKIMFYGPRKRNDAFFQEFKNTIEKIESQLGQYYQFVDEREGKIVLEDFDFQQQIEKKYRNTLTLGQLQLQARLQVCRSEITIIKDKRFDRIPLGYSIYIDGRKRLLQFKEKFLQNFKIFANRYQKKQWFQYQEKTRNYRLVFKQSFQLQDIFKDCLNQQRKSTEDSINIALFMPADKKQKWIQSLLKLLTTNIQFGAQRFKIYILQSNNDQNVMKIVNLPQYSQLNSPTIQYSVQWYCQKLPYNKSANTKINDAVADSLNQVILSKQDIENESYTHICDLSTNTIQFWNNKEVANYSSSASIMPFKEKKDEITFQFNGYCLKFPQEEYNKVVYNKMQKQNRFFLKMPFYRIDLVSMTQVNLFSNYSRKIKKVEVQMDSKSQLDGVKAFYSQKKAQLIYTFRQEDQKNLCDAVDQVSRYLKNLWIKEQIQIKEISNEKFKNLLRERIQVRAQQYGFKYKLDSLLKSIVIQSLYQKDIQKFKSLIDSQSAYLINLSKTSLAKIDEEIKYPDYWQPQINEIQSFDVNRLTKQFVEIQSLFKLTHIYSLTRIQNKFIYKNYKKELEHLTYMNQGKVPKQMMLFHGTGQTPAEAIWGDKEVGFNINYSSDRNLLGRGVYFAENSQYSHSYAYKEIQAGIHIKGMFLCIVLVGDSQLMKMSSVNRDVKGTIRKPNGMTYESMKGIHDISDIYVVYNNRRACPLYYIKYQYK